MGNINNEYHVPEESREEMDVEKLKRCSEGRNWLHPNKQARHHHRRNSHQPSQHWKWPQTGYEQHQTGRRNGNEKVDDQEDSKSRCHTNRIKDDIFLDPVIFIKGAVFLPVSRNYIWLPIKFKIATLASRWFGGSLPLYPSTLPCTDIFTLSLVLHGEAAENL